MTSLRRRWTRLVLAVFCTVACALGSVFAPSVSHGANGQCRWEGGSGADGGHAYCAAEDCIGDGGFAQCTKATAAASGFDDSEVGPDKWANYMCDNLAPSIPKDRKWCEAADGEWAVIGGQGRCINMPADILGGGGTITNSEARAVSISDGWVDRYSGSCSCSLLSDTGWGATIAPTGYCWGGSTVFKMGIATSEQRRRHYQSCSGTVSVYMLRTRGAKCPPAYKSRTRSTAEAECFKPQEAVCPVGNPVSPYSGEKTQTEIDYQPAVFGGLEFIRRYSSSGYYRPSGVTVAPVLPAGELLVTDYWRHNYDRRLYFVSGNAQIAAFAHRADGTLFLFDPAGKETVNRNGAGNRLATNASGGWTLTLADRSVETYNTLGQLLSIRSPGGVTTTLTYDAAGMLGSVSDAFGHQLQIAYNARGQITTVTLPGNSLIQFSYDTWDRLTGVTYPDSTARGYLYEDDRNRWLLTGIVDGNNQRFATYTYDAQGKVTISEHTGAERYEFSYGASATQVKDPRGVSRDYSFVSAAGIVKTASLSAPGSDCGSVKASTFDAAGNLAARTDFNNNQTTYVFDSNRNLETSRTEAYGTPLARTITTEGIRPGACRCTSMSLGGLQRSRTIPTEICSPEP